MQQQDQTSDKKIYFTLKTENIFSFPLNTKNKFLMSKWRIQRTLIKHALEKCKKR